MEIHLISVKVSVVGCGHTEVESEGGPREDLDTMTHHGHLVESGLTIEDDDVIVDQVTLHLMHTIRDVYKLTVLTVH